VYHFCRKPFPLDGAAAGRWPLAAGRWPLAATKQGQAAAGPCFVRARAAASAALAFACPVVKLLSD